MITLKEINLISKYLDTLCKNLIFYFLWIQMKKQVMFIDPTKVVIEYINYPIKISNFNVVAPAVIIKIENLKGFTVICSEKIKVPKKYNVIFIKKN